MSKPTRTIQITLPHDVAHLIEIRAAHDNLRLAEGIEQLLCFVADNYQASRKDKGN